MYVNFVEPHTITDFFSTNRYLCDPCHLRIHYSCPVAAWLEGEFGEEMIHVYIWLGLFGMHLKLLQHC